MKAFNVSIFIMLCSVLLMPQAKTNTGVSVFVLEREINSLIKKVNHSPVSESIILSCLEENNIIVVISTIQPFVSKEMLEYSVLSTTGKLSTLTGYVHLETGSDGSLSFTSDKGQNLVLKSEVNSVQWVFDREQAIKHAKEVNSKFILLIEVEPKNITSELAQNEQFGGQKSINVLLKAILLQMQTNRVVKSYVEDVTRMNAIPSAAIKECVRFLFNNFLKSFSLEDINEK